MVVHLTAADEPALRELLARDPTANVFVQSVVEDHGSAGRRGGPPVDFWGLRAGDRLEAAVFVGALGRLVVPAGADAETGAEIGAKLARRIQIGTLIGERDAVDAIWQACGSGRPRIARAQRLMWIGADDLGPWTSPRLRPARPSDLAEVTQAAAMLHREDMGVDPLASDPGAFRARVAERISSGQTYVIHEDGQLAFKVDVGSRSKVGAQIEGVYTAPAFRRRGLAIGAVGHLCRMLLSSVRWVTLHVNEENEAAIALYRRIGFSGARPYRLLSVEG